MEDKSLNIIYEKEILLGPWTRPIVWRKVPESKLVTKFMNTRFRCSSWQEPLGSYVLEKVGSNTWPPPYISLASNEISLVWYLGQRAIEKVLKLQILITNIVSLSHWGKVARSIRVTKVVICVSTSTNIT
jgi:hypothetical protein